MTRALAGMAALFAALALGFGAVWIAFWPELLTAAHTPRVAFAALPPLGPDAWNAPAMWLVRPGTAFPGAALPPQFAQTRRGKAWVFFVHPAAYFGRRHWNAPLQSREIDVRVADSLRAVISLFADAAAFYAPRYREAGLGALMAGTDDSRRAIALAQADTRAAFAAFAQAVPPDAPVILVGEGEGTLMLADLLRRGLVQRALGTRLVVAYLAGWALAERGDLPALGLPQCTRADQNGCLFAWANFAFPADPRMLLAYARTARGARQAADDRLACTNPLTGGHDAAPAARNLGSFAVRNGIVVAAPIRGAAGAQCDPRSGLLITDTPPHLGDLAMPGNDYSDLSYALFWQNLRIDAGRREAAWERSR